MTLLLRNNPLFRLAYVGVSYAKSRYSSGATAIEYGLIAALISVALIAGAKAIGTNLDEKFDAVATAVKGAAVSPGATT